MKLPALTLFGLGILLLFYLPAGAEIVMTQSVVGNAGGRMSSVNHDMSGTLGQTAIGVVSGPSYLHEIGFWYHTAWAWVGVVEEEEGESELPSRYELGPNYPNPFNPVTTLQFAVPKRSHVTIKLYDILGREVRTVVDDPMDPGYHTTVLDAAGLSSGVYFCRMMAERYVETRKVVLVK